MKVVYTALQNASPFSLPHGSRFAVRGLMNACFADCKASPQAFDSNWAFPYA